MTYDERVAFFRALLAEWDLNPTPWRLSFLLEWARCEHNVGDGLPESRNNPLNTTQDDGDGPEPDEYFNTFYDAQGREYHVRNYDDSAEGVRCTLETLTNGYYEPIIDAIEGETIADREALARAVSTWGTGGFAAEIRGGWSPAPAPTPVPVEKDERDNIPMSATLDYVDALNSAVLALEQRVEAAFATLTDGASAARKAVGRSPG